MRPHQSNGIQQQGRRASGQRGIARSRYPGIRGISIGKNFDTPIENAQDDYLTCLRKVYALADYVAVNISSPNTARLRELQAADGLERILGRVVRRAPHAAETHGKRVPLLVKIAPDLDSASRYRPWRARWPLWMSTA